MIVPKKEMKMTGRLKKRSDFLSVQKAGRKWVSKTMVVETAPNDGHGLRFGLTVSRKASPKAVMRNRIKRRLRALCHDALRPLQGQDIDIVVIGRTLAAEAEYEVLRKDLTWCLRKLEAQPVEDTNA
jgi:ribonuclease P protein component